MKTIAPKCDECGSYGITPEATMSWNFEEQDWELNEWTGFAWCGDCNEDTNFSMVETTKDEYDS